MKLKEIKARIECIKNVVDDYEAAHSAEDDLYHDFIEYISKSDKIPQSIRIKVKQILSTDEINFARYCA